LAARGYFGAVSLEAVFIEEAGLVSGRGFAGAAGSFASVLGTGAFRPEWKEEALTVDGVPFCGACSTFSISAVRVGKQP